MTTKKSTAPGLEGVPMARKKGDPKPEGYVYGKPTSYRPEYCEAIVNYFLKPGSWDLNVDAKGGAKAVPMDKLPTFERFAAGIGVTTRALEHWRDDRPEFAEAYAIASGLQKSFLMELSAAGIGTGAVSLMLQINHKMRVEKDDEDASKPLEIRIVKAVRSESK